MNNEAVQVMTPLIQFGFAGFSLVLVGVIVWQFKTLIMVLRDNTQVIKEVSASNTAAAVQLTEMRGSLHDLSGKCQGRLDRYFDTIERRAGE